MKKIISRLLLCCVIAMFANISYVFAQTTVAGTVKDETGSALPGVNVSIKGTVTGTVTDGSGKFKLNTSVAPPFTIVISSIGFASQELEITGSKEDIDLQLAEQTMLGEEIVVSGSRVEENIMKSPVTIEKMDIIAIQQTSAPDFYDGISRLKGVTTANGSINLTSYNTRGFATIANTRFVQLVDGVDTSAPVLNFPTGNLTGISELDVESVELVPGAASALYGPNAFNGILLMQGKSPFDYQGLSASVKVGVTTSSQADANAEAHGTQPYYSAAIRYAKAFNNKFAFKVNFAFLDAKDWRANQYNTFRTSATNINAEGNPTIGTGNGLDANGQLNWNTTNRDWDGLNTYGDELSRTVRTFSFANPANALSIGTALAANPAFAALGAGAQGAIASALQKWGGSVTAPTYGLREQDLVDNFNATNIKADAELRYRINDNLELSYTYRYGNGSSVYQGAERYALRNFSIQSHRAQLRGKNFFVRGYMTETDDGDSYNLTAVGQTLIAGTALPQFYGNYAGALIPTLLAGLTPSQAQLDGAFTAARTAMVASLNPGSDIFNAQVKTIREGFFKRGGAGFRDNSRLFHGEFNYNFSDMVKFAEIQVGGNVRRYDLFTDGTIYNENTDGTGYKRVTIDEFGVYTQISKSLMEDRLKFTGSIRYDKNENFKGQVTPRVSVVYSAGADKQHNIRASFQTGFRNPDTQAQFIYFPTASGILLGSTERNASPYGIHQGGANEGYTLASVGRFQTTGNPADLVKANLRYLQPEKLSAIEVGYKGVISNKLLLDINVYYNSYKDFISAQTVLSSNTTPLVIQGNTINPFTAFRPYVNSDVPVTSIGAAFGFTYKLPNKFELSGNYSYADFNADLPQGSEFEVQFNTPNNRFTLNLGNRAVFKNVGFDIGYRWQESFIWESAFGHGEIPAFGVVDASINLKLKAIKSMVKIGGTNILGKDYYSNFGGPWVGSLYYVSIAFDEFFR